MACLRPGSFFMVPAGFAPAPLVPQTGEYFDAKQDAQKPMPLATIVAAWHEAHRHQNVAELVSVEFNEDTVRLQPLEPETAPALEFPWAAIRRVCFRDGGIYQSDLIALELQEQLQPALIPLRAKGAPALFAQLVGRGLLPETLVKAALGSADGGFYCWPPQSTEKS